MTTGQALVDLWVGRECPFCGAVITEETLVILDDGSVEHVEDATAAAEVPA